MHTFLKSLGIVLLAALATKAAQAQSYPARPVKMVVPFSAGGPADNYARFLAQRLQESLGQSFVVDNKPGAGSVIGTDFVSKATPDGYTLLVMSNTQTVNESLIPNKPYALMRDFVGVAPINYSDLVLVAHPGSGISSIADLIKRAKADPDKLNYASSGPGTPYHMAGELFKSMAGINIVHIPYKGSGPATNALLGGEGHMMFGVTQGALPHIRSGRLRALAVSSARPSPVLPGLPTVAESGVPGYESATLQGMFAPVKTPAALVTRIHREAVAVMTRLEFKEKFVALGSEVIAGTPDEFAAVIRADMARLSKLIKDGGIKAE